MLLLLLLLSFVLSVLSSLASPHASVLCGQVSVMLLMLIVSAFASGTVKVHWHVRGKCMAMSVIAC
jgi:hypothetical protein